MIGARCYCPAKFFFLVDEPEGNNGAGYSRSYIRTHDDGYCTLQCNRPGGDKRHYQCCGGGAALDHGRDEQPDKQSGKWIGGGEDNGFRCRFSDVL